MIKHVLAIVFALSCVSCASSEVSMQQSELDTGPKAYKNAYREWTRSKEPFSIKEMRDLVRVAATWESVPFRNAYVTRYSDDFDLPKAEAQAMRDREIAEATETHRFLISITGDERSETRLESERSVWKLWLIDDHGLQLAPIKIERISRPNVALRHYFPDATSQRQIYRASFAARTADGLPTIPPTAHWISLRFAGALGQVDLRWDLVSPER